MESFMVSEGAVLVASMFQYLDPFTYASEDQYRFLWMTCFNAMFSEAWTRVGVVIGLFVVVWYWVLPFKPCLSMKRRPFCVSADVPRVM